MHPIIIIIAQIISKAIFYHLLVIRFKYLIGLSITYLYVQKTEFGRYLLLIETVIPASFGTFDLLVLPPFLVYWEYEKLKLDQNQEWGEKLWKKSPLGEVPVPDAMDVAINVDWGGGPVVMILGLLGTPFLQ